MKVIDNAWEKSHLGHPSTVFTVNKRVDVDCSALFLTAGLWEMTTAQIHRPHYLDDKTAHTCFLTLWKIAKAPMLISYSVLYPTKTCKQWDWSLNWEKLGKTCEHAPQTTCWCMTPRTQTFNKAGHDHKGWCVSYLHNKQNVQMKKRCPIIHLPTIRTVNMPPCLLLTMGCNRSTGKRAILTSWKMHIAT